MLEITEKQWNDVKELYQSKLDEIKKLEKKVQDLNNENNALFYENESNLEEILRINDNRTTLRQENANLKKEIVRQEHTMSAVLEKLNTALNMLERYGLKSKCKHTKITSDNLLDEVV